MKTHYGDILDKIDEEPIWWDEYGVPRFCEFSTDRLANIYADEAILLEIHCQECGFMFRVALSSDRYLAAGAAAPLESAIRNRLVHYGDPPNYCCAAGSTMNSVPIRVLEAWTRRRPKPAETSEYEMLLGGGWQRAPDLEMGVVPDWWTE